MMDAKVIAQELNQVGSEVVGQLLVKTPALTVLLDTTRMTPQTQLLESIGVGMEKRFHLKNETTETQVVAMDAKATVLELRQAGYAVMVLQLPKTLENIVLLDFTRIVRPIPKCVLLIEEMD